MGISIRIRRWDEDLRGLSVALPRAVLLEVFETSHVLPGGNVFFFFLGTLYEYVYFCKKNVACLAFYLVGGYGWESSIIEWILDFRGRNMGNCVVFVVLYFIYHITMPFFFCFYFLDGI